MRIAVIGAGPAGSRAAAQLARIGHEVHLLDKSFDREKPCGGGVPWRGLSALAHLSTTLVDGSEPPAGPATTVAITGLATNRCSGTRDETIGNATSGFSRTPREMTGSEMNRFPDAPRNCHDGTMAAAPSASHPKAREPGEAIPLRFGPCTAQQSVRAIAVRSVVFETASGRAVKVALPRPVAVFSRRVLDRALVEDAERAGAVLTQAQVAGVTRAGSGWEIALAGGATEAFDHIVGADGVRSVVRRAIASPFAPEDLSQAVGWYIPARTSGAMTIRFDPRIAGYLWIFPRPDHLAVGACGPLAAGATGALWDCARALLATLGVREDGLARYSALIPTLGPSALDANRVAGPCWSLVGDAAGTVDPLTREGIVHAIRSADLLAAAFARGAPDSYAALWREAFLPEFAWAAQRRERFFAPGLTDRLVRYLSRSAAIRRVMVDLILGDQDYRTLKRRLLRTALPAGLQLASSRAFARFSVAQR